MRPPNKLQLLFIYAYEENFRMDLVARFSKDWRPVTHPRVNKLMKRAKATAIIKKGKLIIRIYK